MTPKKEHVWRRVTIAGYSRIRCFDCGKVPSDPSIADETECFPAPTPVRSHQWAGGPMRLHAAECKVCGALSDPSNRSGECPGEKEERQPSTAEEFEAYCRKALTALWQETELRATADIRRAREKLELQLAAAIDAVKEQKRVIESKDAEILYLNRQLRVLRHVIDRVLNESAHGTPGSLGSELIHLRNIRKVEKNLASRCPEQPAAKMANTPEATREIPVSVEGLRANWETTVTPAAYAEFVQLSEPLRRELDDHNRGLAMDGDGKPVCIDIDEQKSIAAEVETGHRYAAEEVPVNRGATLERKGGRVTITLDPKPEPERVRMLRGERQILHNMTVEANNRNGEP